MGGGGEKRGGSFSRQRQREGRERERGKRRGVGREKRRGRKENIIKDFFHQRGRQQA